METFQCLPHVVKCSEYCCEKAISGEKDDIFASSSRETVIPSQNIYPMGDTSLVIQALVGTNNPGVRFCFFCPSTFVQDTALSDHVRYQHSKEIQKLSRNRLDILCFHSCPFCCARFYSKSLLPQHLIQDHCELFSQLFKKNNTDEFVKCPFCDYKILSAFENLLSHHVDEAHIADLQEYLTANHSINIKSETFLQSFCLENLPETPGLSDKFAQLTTNAGDKYKVKNEKSVRRGLFAGKENGVVSKQRPSALRLKHSSIDQTPKTTSCWQRSSTKPLPKKTRVHFATSTPKSHVTQRGPKLAGDFRCGTCPGVYFTTNADLVQHIKHNHNAVKALLNPLYGCGQCHATFYKNTFIKRHHRFHHTFIE